MKVTTMIGSAALSMLCVSGAIAQSTAPDNTTANKAPMNSTSSTSTADAQSNKSSDLVLTQKIRKSVMADKKLSTYAHNVKIVSVGGSVTLNGVVRSAAEKKRVLAKAEHVAGKGNVTNDLKIQAE